MEELWIYQFYLPDMTHTTQNEECKHCKKPIAQRNPSGYCDHLKYPENCDTCSGNQQNDKKKLGESVVSFLQEIDRFKGNTEQIDKLKRVVKNQQNNEELIPAGTRTFEETLAVIKSVENKLKNEEWSIKFLKGIMCYDFFSFKDQDIDELIKLKVTELNTYIRQQRQEAYEEGFRDGKNEQVIKDIFKAEYDKKQAVKEFAEKIDKLITPDCFGDKDMAWNVLAHVDEIVQKALEVYEGK